jgi:hypothetical protein
MRDQINCSLKSTAGTLGTVKLSYYYLNNLNKIIKKQENVDEHGPAIYTP